MTKGVHTFSSTTSIESSSLSATLRLSSHSNKEVHISRQLYWSLMNMVPIASEMLDTISSQYLAEFIACGD
ncbi:DHAP synthase, class 1 [Penicillium camemberti]|uniref:DHAP synthase, class 1 n=1 Tax=Penicillium camemberti (strain FM 013) TaxID=1429867 RepID=A0A0G4NTR3_PENC3|nr:DHAP synthase, class 1 [Penicillium camemberti]